MLSCLWKPFSSCPKKAIGVLIKTIIVAVNGATAVDLYIPDELLHFSKNIPTDNPKPVTGCENPQIQMWTNDINICIFRNLKPLQENSLRKILKYTQYCIQRTRPSNCHLQRFSELETISNEVFRNIRDILTEKNKYSNLIANDWKDIIEEIRRQEGKNFLNKYFNPDAIDYYHRHKKNTVYRIEKETNNANSENKQQIRNKHKYIYSNKEIFEEIRMNEPFEPTKQRLTKETSDCFLNTEMETMNNCSYYLYLYSTDLKISKQEHLKQNFLNCFRDHFKHCQGWIAEKVIKINAEILSIAIPSDFALPSITFQNGYITCPSLLNQKKLTEMEEINKQNSSLTTCYKLPKKRYCESIDVKSFIINFENCLSHGAAKSHKSFVRLKKCIGEELPNCILKLKQFISIFEVVLNETQSEKAIVNDFMLEKRLQKKFSTIEEYDLQNLIGYVKVAEDEDEKYNEILSKSDDVWKSYNPESIYSFPTKIENILTQHCLKHLIVEKIKKCAEIHFNFTSTLENVEEFLSESNLSRNCFKTALKECSPAYIEDFIQLMDALTKYSYAREIRQKKQSTLTFISSNELSDGIYICGEENYPSLESNDYKVVCSRKYLGDIKTSKFYIQHKKCETKVMRNWMHEIADCLSEKFQQLSFEDSSQNISSKKNLMSERFKVCVHEKEDLSCHVKLVQEFEILIMEVLDKIKQFMVKPESASCSQQISLQSLATCIPNLHVYFSHNLSSKVPSNKLKEICLHCLEERLNNCSSWLINAVFEFLHLIMDVKTLNDRLLNDEVALVLCEPDSS